MLAALYNIPVDAETLQRFSFHNRDAHDTAIQRILEQFNLKVTTYLLDPIPDVNIPGWLYQHQASHNEINAVLGVDGYDLSAVDFSQPDQVSAWIYNHASEHLQWGNSLGYG